MLGMGYAVEALHLPGISKRLEFELAMQSNDLKRALQCLLTMSNSRDIGQETSGLDLTNLLNVAAKKENIVDAVQGIAKYAKQFLDLIDAADATAQSEIAREALKRLAAAGSVKGALQSDELRGLALRLANHGELTRLSTLVNNLISIGLGREAAFSAAVLGDNALMEKAWHETGMLAEAVLHSHAHGRPTLKNLVETWNKMLQKDIEHTRTTKTDATAAFLASLEDPKLPSLGDTGKKPPIEILPPGMSSLSLSISAPKKPLPATKALQQEPGKQLLLEAPPSSAPINGATAPPADAGESSAPLPVDPNQPGSSSEESSQPGASLAEAESSQPQATPPESNQPVATPPESSQLEEKSTEADAAIEVSDQPKLEGTPSADTSEPGASNQVDSSQLEAPKPADSSQSGVPPATSSNQPEASPSTIVSTQPILDSKDFELQLLGSTGPQVTKPSSSRSVFADLEQLM